MSWWRNSGISIHSKQLVKRSATERNKRNLTLLADYPRGGCIGSSTLIYIVNGENNAVIYRHRNRCRNQ